MAQYYNDCTSLTGWTETTYSGATRFSISGGFIVDTGVNTVEFLELDSTAADADRDDFDILVKVRTTAYNTGQERIVAARIGNADTWYAAAWRSGTTGARLTKRVSGSITEIASGSFTFTAATDYWVRFRGQGTALKVKYWSGDPADEPGGVASDASWTISTTDSDHSTAGINGLAEGGNTATKTFRSYGFASAGAYAPSAAPGGGAPTISALSAINITANSAQPRISYS